MGAVRSKLAADLRHRRLQAFAIGMVLLLASGASTLALSILVEAQAPFDRAFERANGAHLVVDYTATVPAMQLTATLSSPDVSTGAGPWPVARAAISHPAGGVLQAGVVSGLDRPDPGLDRVTLVSGRWWQASGEVVLQASEAGILGASVGDTVNLIVGPAMRREAGGGPVLVPREAAPSTPAATVTLTVVGIAAAVSTPDVIAWAAPADIGLLAGDTEPAQRMIYRVVRPGSAAEVGEALRSITAALAADAVIDSRSYLDTKSDVDQLANLYVPVLLAFAAFALLAAGFMVANVVSGIVLANYRDIGIMKALGFTPGDVIRVLLGQVLTPAAIGSIAGLLLGIVLSRPTVEATARSFGVPGEFVPTWWIFAVIPGISLAIAGLAALGPAIQGGRIGAVAAIAHGRAPSRRPGAGRLRRLGLRLPVPLPACLGLSIGLAHPARAAMLMGALVAGVAAATFAVGLNSSLIKVMEQTDRGQPAPVRGQLNADPASAAEVNAAIVGHPDTGHAVAIGEAQASLAGLGRVLLIGYQGASDWIGYELIDGRWFDGPGEAVAPTSLFTQSGIHIGDRVTLTDGGRTREVTLVGEIFDTDGGSTNGLILRLDWTDLVAVDPSATISRWEMQPRAGVEPRQYAASMGAATVGRLATYVVGDSRDDADFLLFLSVVVFLGGTLIAVSFGGVFNTVLLETRRLTREVAILKAGGSTPRQVTGMVIASIVPAGLLAGVIGLPIGLVFQRAVLTHMGEVAASTRIPDSSFDVFPPLMLLGLALAGLAIATAGSFLPAQRAARAPIAAVLQAE